MNPINLEKIPIALRERKQWVLWKLIERDGDKTKLPFQATGASAKSNDPLTWNNLSNILARYDQGGYAGIGYVFHSEDPFVGIDLDGCRNPETGAVAEWAKDVIRRLDTYAEVSPSETGVKLWVAGKNPLGESGRKVIVAGAETIGNKTPAIEIYDRLRYFAVTGWRLAGPTQPEPNDPALKWLAETFFKDTAPEAAESSRDWRCETAVLERARKYLARLPAAVSGQKGHDATFHAACCLVLGFGLPEGEAMGLLREYNQLCVPAWTERELQHKVRQAMKQPGERNYLRNAKPERWDGVKVPSYRAPPEPVKHEPKITTLAHAAKDYVQSLREGKAELVSLGIGELDYAIGGGVEPGEMVIIAARPSHGKSAVALQCCHQWTAAGRACLVVSEEMSSMALGKRTLQYVSDVPEEHWSHSLDQLDKAVAEYSLSHQKTIIAESCVTAEAAVEQIDVAVKEHKIQAAIVDYAQILRGVGKTRYEQITATSIMLKQAATRHNIVVLLLCQLGRAIESRTKFIPVMSDIKETGQLEQDADVILFLMWPHRLDAANPPGKFMFFVGKNRNRAINQGAVECLFIPSRQMVLESKPERAANYDPAFDNYNAEQGF